MKNIASIVDHTLLKAEATKESIEKLCEEAKKYGFATVCVNPCHVELCHNLLKGTNVGVATVVGFPLGANTKEVKAFETTDAINNGASEIDMVINIGALKDQDFETVKEDIETVVKAANNKAIVKVIIETALLNDEEKKKASQLALEANADFVKTSTGFSSGGATEEDVRLISNVVEDKMLIKASGGIKNSDSAQKMIKTGASRLGTSSGVHIAKEELI